MQTRRHDRPPEGTSRRRVPARAWTLALLDVICTLTLVGALISPLGPHTVAAVKLASAAALLIAAGAALICGGRMRDGALLALACVRLMVVVALLAIATSAAATVVACTGLIAVAVWASAFFRTREVALMLAAEALSVAIATAINPDHVRTAVCASAVLLAAGSGALLLLRAFIGLRREAQTDQLTGLLNRRGLDQALRTICAVHAHGQEISLIVIDLDGLKAVNDRDGHQAGDRLLQAFGNELAAAARYGDLLARVGGDEFVAVLPGRTRDQAYQWAAALAAGSRIARSHGVAERLAAEPLKSWLGRADARMYEAKAHRHATPLLPV